MRRLRESIPPSFVQLLITSFLVSASIQAVRPIASYRALELGASAFGVGLVASSFALLSLFAALPIGRRIDGSGERAALLLGVILVEGGAVTMVLAPSIPVLAVSQALLGLGHVSYLLACQSIVARIGKKSSRDSRFSTYTLMQSSGQLVGPVMAGLVVGGAVGRGAVGASGSRDLLMLLTVMLVVALGMALLVFRNPRLAPARGPSEARSTRTGVLRSVGPVLRVRGMPQAMLTSVTFLTSIDILVAYLPAYGEAVGLSIETVGFLLAARAGASLVVRAFLVPLIARLGRRRLLMLCCVIPAVAFAGLPFLGQVPLMFAVMIAAGLGLGLGQPLSLTWVASAAPREYRGAALGIRVAGNRLGQLTVPGLVGVFAGGIGLGVAFISITVLLTASATVLLRTGFGRDDPGT